MYLDESNVFGVLTEALSADVEAVLSDQTPVTATDAAAWTINTSDIDPRQQWISEEITYSQLHAGPEIIV